MKRPVIEELFQKYTKEKVSFYLFFILTMLQDFERMSAQSLLLFLKEEQKEEAVLEQCQEIIK